MLNAQSEPASAVSIGRMASPQVMIDLLQRVADSQDPDAFQQLFETYVPRVRSYMLRQGADSATADELAQETLLTVWRKAALYSGEKGNPTTWIFTIARNLRIDRIRRETRLAGTSGGPSGTAFR